MLHIFLIKTAFQMCLKLKSTFKWNLFITIYYKRNFLYSTSSNDKTYVMSKMFTVAAVWLLLISSLLVLMWIDYKV